MTKNIFVKGAREHNLKNIDVEIPRDKLVVITGISGSGKSSLAFDTIYAEGQRRYVESLSAYARQFLGKMMKPDVEYIDGLSPAIAIQQRPLSHNPRSTVGTVTEIYDYLRLLYARIGKPHCHRCGKPIERQTVQEIVDQVLDLPKETKIMVLAPIIRGRKGTYQKLFADLKKKGFIRVKVDDSIYNLDEKIPMDKYKKHNIDVIVDRLVIKSGIKKILTDSIETALNLAEKIVKIEIVDKNKPNELMFSQHFACLNCNISFDELEPRNFSFNNPFGSCPVCEGLGSKMEVDEDLLIPDKSLSISNGAISPYGEYRDNWYFKMLESLSNHYHFSLDTPFQDLDENIQDIILYGSRDTINFKVDGENSMYEFNKQYEGVVNNIERRYRETKSDYSRQYYLKFMTNKLCKACNGKRLKPESLSVYINDKSIMDVCELSIEQVLEFIDNLKLNERETIISKEVIKEIKQRLQFLKNVGLTYLTLEREAGSLSAGEAQRIHLATQIGSNLVGVLYVLDEPSIGLHQRDNKRLLNTLIKLRDLGNTILVVEHDHETILTADHIIDLGPGAGEHGGNIVFSGTPRDLLECKESITGKYISGKEKIEIPKIRREPKGWIEIIGAKEHNLKNINVKIPLGTFTCITGVSGAGKSTLINEILFKALAKKINRASAKPGKHDKIKGITQIDKLNLCDQSPIGRTPRSNPGTYTKVFDDIRNLFAKTPEAKSRNYKPGRFSFNVRGGRCEACQGNGMVRIDMFFLPPVYVPCDICKGARFNRQTLEVKYKGKTIENVLNMTVEEGLKFFENIPRIKRKLQMLSDVGLGYVAIGQSSPTLSGGEAQRIKLARELSKKATGNTLYILDEPTTGLSTYDIKKLLNVLQRLIEKGERNTVVVIEHNLDVIKSADYIIDLGPEGGENGGEIVAQGTPEQIIKNEKSYTGNFLKKVLLE
ncbi:MAG: excinuclease ABC subunit UvrA [Candidatus Helarchaeota archaeon]